ncbi:MAG: DUF1844 domain-containing protein [Pirellulaceae bacterium]
MSEQNMSEQNEEPKLIIDEDWKTQVQREKEELAKKQEEKQDASTDSGVSADSPAAEVTSPDKPAADAASPDKPVAEDQPLPPASIMILVTSLGTQAMAAMGLMPGDDGQPLPANFQFAKHFIDLLGVLEEKTKGNLTDEESAYLTDTLYQLRMAFVEVKKRGR